MANEKKEVSKSDEEYEILTIIEDVSYKYEDLSLSSASAPGVPGIEAHDVTGSNSRGACAASNSVGDCPASKSAESAVHAYTPSIKSEKRVAFSSRDSSKPSFRTFVKEKVHLFLDSMTNYDTEVSYDPCSPEGGASKHTSMDYLDSSAAGRVSSSSAAKNLEENNSSDDPSQESDDSFELQSSGSEYQPPEGLDEKRSFQIATRSKLTAAAATASIIKEASQAREHALSQKMEKKKASFQMLDCELGHRLRDLVDRLAKDYGLRSRNPEKPSKKRLLEFIKREGGFPHENDPLLQRFIGPILNRWKCQFRKY